MDCCRYFRAICRLSRIRWFKPDRSSEFHQLLFHSVQQLLFLQGNFRSAVLWRRRFGGRRTAIMRRFNPTIMRQGWEIWINPGNSARSRSLLFGASQRKPISGIYSFAVGTGQHPGTAAGDKTYTWLSCSKSCMDERFCLQQTGSDAHWWEETVKDVTEMEISWIQVSITISSGVESRSELSEEFFVCVECLLICVFLCLEQWATGELFCDFFLLRDDASIPSTVNIYRVSKVKYSNVCLYFLNITWENTIKSDSTHWKGELKYWTPLQLAAFYGPHEPFSWRKFAVWLVAKDKLRLL